MTHILVTRPLESSQQLAEQLDARGLTPIVMPLYTFTAREPSFDMTTAWSVPGARSLAVFTSPRAVRFGLPHIPDSRLKDLAIAAIGSATRNKLESYGYTVHVQATSGYTSEDLLRAPQLAADPGVAVIFCAPGGRDTLAKGLSDLGWSVLNAMVYERLALFPTSAQANAINNANKLISIWTSISALELARENLPADAWVKILNAPALVISTRIQHHLQQLGADRVECADGPGNAALMKSVLRLTGQQE